MKYRVVELLKCPRHPGSMLRVVGSQVSDVFPYAGQLQIPVCRNGCGYLGNWFVDIPNSLPPHHRIDCRRCLGTEIESGILTCPDCDWEIYITEGILDTTGGQEVDIASFDIGLKKKAGMLIDKLLSLQPGELIIKFETLPEGLTENWLNNGIEQIQVEVCGQAVQDCRARSFARGQGLVYHFSGPLKPDIFREGNFDAIVVAVPSARLSDYDQSLDKLIKLMRKSGRALFVYQRLSSDRTNISDRHEKILSDLPDEFKRFRTRLIDAGEYDFLQIEYPEPEIGSGIHRIDAGGKDA